MKNSLFCYKLYNCYCRMFCIDLKRGTLPGGRIERWDVLLWHSNWAVFLVRLQYNNTRTRRLGELFCL